ncbi:type VII secretion protein EssA [Pueribacillus sp. YX66]|uniref:type VII secretion protein EssA n=1 Tax=Pueribacillus sp. YX66 TaxID=3229242 RepID=UPI00358D4000
MKGCLKRTSILILFLFLALVLLLAFPVNAEETLQHTGKLRFKQERIGGNNALSGQEISANTETELEKIAPELFDDTTKKMIETKQVERDEEQAELEKTLFLQPHEENVVLKETEAVLFANDYVTPRLVSEAEEHLESSDSGSTNTPILASLIGVALAICGGIYAFMRRMFE